MENETIENLDSLNQEEVVTNNEDTLDVDKLKETNSKLYTRAKSAEQELRELKAKMRETPVKDTTNPDTISRSEYEKDLLRIAKGYDDETIAQLEIIARGKGVKLTEAMQDPMFQSILEKKEAESKEKKASLRASKGSGSHQPLDISKMSQEDHKAYMKEMASKLN